MPTNYKVKSGDCISSIAFEHGFFPDTVWNDEGNITLREQRKNPNTLAEGDMVVIPNKRLQNMSKETEARHKFRRKGVPERLRIRLEDNGLPRAELEYRLVIEGTIMTGTTDGDGWLDHPIPPNAIRGSLLVEGDEMEYELEIGTTAPIDSKEGVEARLRNLGFLEEDENGDIDEDMLKESITMFQAYCGLPVSGEADEDTRQKLSELHHS